MAFLRWQEGRNFHITLIYWVQTPNQDTCVSVCFTSFFSNLTLTSSNLPPFISNIEKAKLKLESKLLYIVAVTIMKRAGLSPQKFLLNNKSVEN